mgnify:CR=1 FL=1
MDDLISREALKNAIATARTNYNTCPDYNELFKYFSDVVSAMIDELPAVDAEPVRYGKWIKASGMLPPECHDKKRCSVCANFALHDRLGRVRPSNYCPNCGAKMDEEQE